MFGRIKDEKSPNWESRKNGDIPPDTYPCGEGYPQITETRGEYGAPGYWPRIFLIILTDGTRGWATVEWGVTVDNCPAWRLQGGNRDYVSYFTVAGWSSKGERSP